MRRDINVLIMWLQHVNICQRRNILVMMSSYCDGIPRCLDHTAGITTSLRWNFSATRQVTSIPVLGWRKSIPQSGPTTLRLMTLKSATSISTPWITLPQCLNLQLKNEAADGEITSQLAKWNIQTGQNGAWTSSQGSNNFNGEMQPLSGWASVIGKVNSIHKPFTSHSPFPMPTVSRHDCDMWLFVSAWTF